MYPSVSSGPADRLFRARTSDEVEARMRASCPLSLSLWVLAYKCLDTARGFFAMWPLRADNRPGVVINATRLLYVIHILFPGVRSVSNESRLTHVDQLCAILWKLFDSITSDLSCIVGTRHMRMLWIDLRTWCAAMAVLRREGFRGRSSDPDGLVSTFVTSRPLQATKLGDPALRRSFVSPTQIKKEPCWFPHADRGYSALTTCFGVPLQYKHLLSWSHVRMQCGIIKHQIVTHLYNFFDASEAPIMTREELCLYPVPTYPEVQPVVRFHHHNVLQRIIKEKSRLLRSIGIECPSGRMPTTGVKRDICILARELETALVRLSGIKLNKSYGYIVARPVDTVLEVLKEVANPTIGSFEDE